MSFSALLGSETPPRMWRKRSNGLTRHGLSGNTSTYVEKTQIECSRTRSSEKHLHVCGENIEPEAKRTLPEETPPRMWRKLVFTEDPKIVDGNTSTYVEKTRRC